MTRYFSGRLLVIHLLAALAVGICIWLSSWQWNKAQAAVKFQPVSGEVTFAELSPLRDFLPPKSVGIVTAVNGTWQEDSRFEFPGRPIDGSKLINPNPDDQESTFVVAQPGTWIVDVLKITDNSSIGVVRGWTQTPDLIESPKGAATLTGVLQPSEDAPGLNLITLPSYLTTNKILAKSDTTVHDGYFVSATLVEGLELVKPIFDTPMEVQFNWRNIIYTFNWIIFGIIIFGMWWRIIQDEVNLQTELLAEEI
jgi:hypothetical protein